MNLHLATRSKIVVMGNDDESSTIVFRIVEKELFDDFAGDAVKVARRLIGEEDLRLAGNSPCDGEALFLAA